MDSSIAAICVPYQISIHYQLTNFFIPVVLNC